MRSAADASGVQIVTGDTKVVQKGGADKLFINTDGIGMIDLDHELSAANARPGDKVVLSGNIGDHGTTIMIARGELDLETDIESDTAPLNQLIADILDEAASQNSLNGIRSFRDPTRGGVATTLNEIAMSSDVCIEIAESKIPVREEVRGACEILGLDPLYVANEGKMIAIACIIGEVKAEPKGIVSMTTAFGGTRIVDMLASEQPPRIC
jgi:hydrogenase expression/formation protein HypE